MGNRILLHNIFFTSVPPSENKMCLQPWDIGLYLQVIGHWQAFEDMTPGWPLPHTNSSTPLCESSIFASDDLLSLNNFFFFFFIALYLQILKKNKTPPYCLFSAKTLPLRAESPVDDQVYITPQVAHFTSNFFPFIKCSGASSCPFMLQTFHR